MSISWGDIIGICALFWCALTALNGVVYLITALVSSSLDMGTRESKFVAGIITLALSGVVAVATAYWRNWL